SARRRRGVAAPAVPRRAGVNAFGFGGINTHAVLEDLPGEEPRESLTPRGGELFVLTAGSRAALEEKLAAWSAALPGLAGHELRDVAYTASLQFNESEPGRLGVGGGGEGGPGGG